MGKITHKRKYWLIREKIECVWNAGIIKCWNTGILKYMSFFIYNSQTHKGQGSVNR